MLGGSPQGSGVHEKTLRRGMKYDVVIIGGGLAGLTAGVELQKAGKRCVVVAGGRSLHETPQAEFVSLGGTFLRGDFAVRGEWNGNVLSCVYTRNLGKTRLEAPVFIIATGKYFSKGLVSSIDGIREPLFDCEVEYEKDRAKWTDPDFFAPQPFETFGVKTDPLGRVTVGGRRAENLYAAGELLAGKHDIESSTIELCRRLI